MRFKSGDGDGELKLVVDGVGDKDTDDGSRHEDGSSGGEDFTSLSPSSR